jgi:hypothetical protein
MWMAIYDPSYNIGEMLMRDQVFTAQIDANARTVVSIGLVHYRYLNGTSNYRYRKSISLQSFEIICL